MVGKSQAKPGHKTDLFTVSPQMWALNPIVSTAGMLGWSEVMKKSLHFVSECAGKNLQLQRDFLKCNSLEGFLRLQSAFCLDAFEQYTKHYQHVTQILSDSTALGINEATTPRARSYDDIPL